MAITADDYNDLTTALGGDLLRGRQDGCPFG